VTVVLDADVLIGALDSSDAHHAAARSLFTAWRGGGEVVAMSVVNLSEVLVAPAADRQSLRRARAAISALGVEVHQPHEAIGVDAARLRRLHPISLADAYCLATARHTGAQLASFDARLVQAADAEGIAVATEVTATGRTPRSGRRRSR
jgi:predicted nucleic acid-binding protein